MPLVNCQVSLTLTRTENCVLTSKATRNFAPGLIIQQLIIQQMHSTINNSTNATLKIKDTNCMSQ